MTDIAMPKPALHAGAATETAFARWPAWALIVALAVAYFVSARLGLLLAIPGGHVTPVWPPSGIALAALLLCGWRIWPGIWLGSFAANLWDFVGSPMGLATDIATSATFGAGASAAALLGAQWLLRCGIHPSRLERVRDVCALMALGGAASCLVNATIGVTTLCLAGFAPWSAYGQLWLTWWLGDTTGVFVMAPLLLVWHRATLSLHQSRWLETACCFSLLMAATAYVFIDNTLPFSGKPLAFIIIPFLVWPAMRFGARGATAAVVLIAALAVWGTIHGTGPFNVGSRNASLLMLELFLGVVVLTSLCVAAIVTERERAEAAQKRAFDDLSRARDDAEQANRAKSALLAALSMSEVKNREHAAYLQSLLEALPTGVSLVDKDLVVTVANQACLVLLDLPAVVFHQGAALENVFRYNAERGDYGSGDAHTLVAARMALARDPKLHQFERVRPDGSAVAVHGVPLPDGSMLTTYTDISVRKQAEHALVAARDAAEAANRAKSAFLATMSHEIRTPMNGVVGMIEVLEQSKLDDAQVEVVKTIRESAYALLAIVNDVLDFSKIEAGQFDVVSEAMDVATVVEGVCDTLDPMAGKKGVALTLFTDPAMPRQVLGDAARLRQVLLNLASNAIKFSSAEERAGRVSVCGRLVESGVQQVVLEFSVTDNGIGIDKETLARLFTPFTQADASTTRRFGGTGLGLSISHRLAELMGGEIGVRSEPGRGSTFTLRLPVAPLPAGPERKAEMDAEACELAGLCCLVLGSVPGPADDLAVYLKHSGAAVHRAADLVAARAWFCNAPPGPWIGVIAGADGMPNQMPNLMPNLMLNLMPNQTPNETPNETLDDALAGLRALRRSRSNPEACFVVIERGRCRGPRVEAADLVSLAGDGLHRSVFIKAVAVAAGRTRAPAKEHPSFIADTTPAPLSMQEASAQGRLILVAEDNEVNQEVLRRQLALLGFKADIARTGSEALACWRRGDYALLLTDLHMPQMDGYELTVAIRAAEAGEAGEAGARRMPIVALTANALASEAKHCRDLGMDDYMTKPVQLAVLNGMLHKWLQDVARPTPNSGSPASMTAAPALALDVSVLKALVGDEPQVIEEFLQDFRVSAGEAAVQMRAACLARQTAVVETVAHRLKSSARSVGALALGELCAAMEHAGQAGGRETLADLWPRFEAEIAAVDEFLRSSQA